MIDNLFEHKILKRFSHDVVIDLGTSDSSVIVRSAGIKFSEPSFVAYDLRKKSVIAVGHEAKKMLGRTPPEIKIVKPIKEGVIGNFEMASALIDYLLKKIKNSALLKPRIMAAIPVNSSEVERRAIQEALRIAGARVVYLIEQVVAAAIGADIPVMDAYGGLVVDFGAAACRVAIISLGGIVMNRTTPIAGDSVDDAIAAMMRRKFNLLIGDNSAQELKKQLGFVFTTDQEMSMLVKGRDITSGLPACVSVTSQDVSEAMSDCLKTILELVKSCIELAPHELIGDIIEKGITISGGMSFLRGLDRFLSEGLNLKCKIAPDPSFSVALGMERILADSVLMNALFSNRRDRANEL